MQKSESIAALAKALKAVQIELKPALKNSVNPFFKASYADLGSVWDSCRNLLAKNGLSVTQTMDVGEGHTLIVETILLHESGEWIGSRLPMILSKNDPQGIGMAITYARRYGLSAIIGVCSEDDDAESTVDRKKAQPAKKKPTTESYINLDFLKQSLEALQDAKKTAWSNLSITNYLKSKYSVDGKSVSEVAGKLNKAQAQEFIKEITTALSEVKADDK